MNAYEFYGILIEGILMLMILSYLYKENILFRIAEEIMLSVMVANTFVMGLSTIQKSAVQPLLGGQIEYLLLIVMGLALYTRFWKDYDWISRYPMGWILGIGIGLMLSKVVGAQITGQIRASLGPITLENVLFWSITVCTLSFFIFHKEVKDRNLRKAMSNIRLIGRWGLMLMASAMLAMSVTSRINLVIGIVKKISTWITTIV